MHYRLRGEVGGIVRAYPLAAGENWIGSMSGNAIVLPVRGVSRRHAFVVLDDEGLVLEDMGSKNGTLANGVRIQRTRLRAGDEFRVGPVTLRVEAVDADDAALAIALGGGEDTAAAPRPQTRPRRPWNRRRGPDLDTVEGLLGHLLAGAGATSPGALDILVRETGAAGGCLFTRERGEIVSLATSGALPDLADLTVLTEGAPPRTATSLACRRPRGRSPAPLRLRGRGTRARSGCAWPAWCGARPTRIACCASPCCLALR